jgi:hypothetical protein
MAIYQKKSPKTCFTARLTNDNYDRLCRMAGELSLAAALNRLIELAQKAGVTFCERRCIQGTIRSE